MLVAIRNTNKLKKSCISKMSKNSIIRILLYNTINIYIARSYSARSLVVDTLIQS